MVITPYVDHEYFHHFIHFEVKVPGALRSQVFSFYEDTGSSMPTLFQSDIDALNALSPQMAPIRPNGPIVSKGIGGRAFTQGYGLDFRVVGTHGEPYTDWYRLKTSVHPDTDKQKFGVRLSGEWWRNVLFSASAPNGKYNLYVANSKMLLANNIPEVNLSKVRPEPMARGYPPKYVGPALAPFLLPSGARGVGA